MAWETRYSSGEDVFENNVFNHLEWSAPFMIHSRAISEWIELMCLEGRIIKKIRLIGPNYIHVWDYMLREASRQFPHKSIDEMAKLPGYEAIPAETMYSREVKTDDPLLIAFNDGDVFEIAGPHEPVYRLDMNCIPWEIKGSQYDPNEDANILFSTCIGKKVEKVDINICQKDEGHIICHDFDDDSIQPKRVSSIALRFDDGSYLAMGPQDMFFNVALYDCDNKVQSITFRELKSGLLY